MTHPAFSCPCIPIVLVTEAWPSEWPSVNVTVSIAVLAGSWLVTRRKREPVTVVTDSPVVDQPT
jgi:hypothetical protein